MKLTSRATILVAPVVAGLLVPAVAWGVFSTARSNPGNTVTAGVLKAPGTLSATAHVPDNAGNTGDVTLTWNDGLGNTGSLNPGGYVVERQTAGSTLWQTVATPTYGSACNAATHTCTVTDATAAFNTTYSYRISSTVGSWTAGPTTVRVAASVAPSAVEDRPMPIDALYSVAQSGSGLIAVGQNGRILVCSGTCTGSGSWQVATSPTTNDLYRVVFDASGSGRAWAAGAGGTVLTCASNCTSTAAGTWTSVNAGTTASLYGIGTTSGYVAVVGANRTMRYTTDAAFTTWQTGTVSAGTGTTTLYGIAVAGPKNVVAVGSLGVIAGCSFTSGGSSAVCGGATALTAVGYAGGTSAPTTDMRDVAYVSGSGNSDHIYAVGAGGNVYVSTSMTSGYTKKATGSTADLNAVAAVSQNAAGAVGEPVSPNSSVFLRCTASCSSTGTWSAGPDTGTTKSLFGIAGSGSTYWAVGASGIVRYFNGTAWITQLSGPVPVSTTVVQTNDINRYTVTTATTLSPPCTTPALVATATVPARSSAAVTSPTVKVTIGYVFAGATNTSQVALSTNGGSTWSTPVALTSNVAAATAKTVDFTGTVTGSDSSQQIVLCVQGAGGGGQMNVDMVHVDVEE